MMFVFITNKLSMYMVHSRPKNTRVMDKQRHRTSIRPPATGHELQLQKAFRFMFPPSYLEARHFPVSDNATTCHTGLFCTLMNLKYTKVSEEQETSSLVEPISKSIDPELDSDLSSKGHYSKLKNAQVRKYIYEVSTDPCSRASIRSLRHNLNSSLTKHGAKMFGLCPIRRSIYDQCFDELIRQVTVTCIEQGLLLYRVRNEIKLTLECYRGAYESAVNYGVRKAIDSDLKLDECLTKVKEMEKLQEAKDDEKSVKEEFEFELKNKLDAFDKMRQHYEMRIVEMDKVIAHQKSMIEILSVKLVDSIDGPS